VAQRVVWVNQSGVAHTVTLCTLSACPGAPASTGKDTFDIALGAASGSRASHVFKTAGKYFYYCRIHGYAAMHGEVVVNP
jgi:plastocyanin